MQCALLLRCVHTCCDGLNCHAHRASVLQARMYAIAAADLEARVLKVVKGFDRIDASKVSLSSLSVQFVDFRISVNQN